MRRFTGQADQAELDLSQAQQAYLASAQTEQAKCIDQKIQEDRQQADLQRQRTVDELIRTSQGLINQGKDREALTTNGQILALDPKNDYAVGINPLLEDKVQLQTERQFEELKRRKSGEQFAKGQGGQVPYDDILRYPTDWPDLSKMAARKDGPAKPPSLALGVPLREAEQLGRDRTVDGKVELKESAEGV